MIRIIVFAAVGVLIGFVAGGFLGVSVFWKSGDTAVTTTAFSVAFVFGLVGVLIARLLNHRDAQRTVQSEPSSASPIPSWASVVLNVYSALIIFFAVLSFGGIMGAIAIGLLKGAEISLLLRFVFLLFASLGTLILAWGIWKKKKWVIPLFALFVASAFVSMIVKWAGVASVIPFLLAGGTFALAYKYRASFSSSVINYPTQAAFLVSLIASWILIAAPSLFTKGLDMQKENSPAQTGQQEQQKNESENKELSVYATEGPNGFSLQYPSYFSVKESPNSFVRKDGNFVVERISITLLPGSLEGVKYVNQASDYMLQYSRGIWNSTPYDPALNQFEPEYYVTKYPHGGLGSHIFKTQDGPSAWETAYVEHPSKQYVLMIQIDRNNGYIDCIIPCPGEKPFSDDRTIYTVADSLQFTEPKAVTMRDINLARYMRLQTPSVQIDDITYGDFDGDGKEEVALSVYESGTGGLTRAPYVLKLLDDGSLIELKIDRDNANVRISKGGERFGTVQNKLVMFFNLYQDDDPYCCPTKGMRFILLQWDNSKSLFVPGKIVDIENVWLSQTLHAEGEGAWGHIFNEGVRRLGLTQ